MGLGEISCCNDSVKELNYCKHSLSPLVQVLGFSCNLDLFSFSLVNRKKHYFIKQQLLPIIQCVYRPNICVKIFHLCSKLN